MCTFAGLNSEVTQLQPILSCLSSYDGKLSAPSLLSSLLCPQSSLAHLTVKGKWVIAGGEGRKKPVRKKNVVFAVAKLLEASDPWDANKSDGREGVGRW